MYNCSVGNAPKYSCELLTPCYEPLQKLRVRLGTCKTGLSPLLIVPSRYFCGGSFCFMSWCLNFFCAVGALFLVKVTEWPPIGKIAAHSSYDMFHGIST